MAIDDETLYGLKGKQIKQVVEEIKESEAAFKPFPASVVTDGTTEQFMSSILALNEPVGTAFLGTVSLSDLPAGLLQEEVAVYVYSDYVVYCEVKSTDVSPYAWWCASYNYQGWRPVNTDTTYSAGTGLNLNGTTFSVNTTTIQEKLDSTQMSAVNSGIDSTKVGQISTNTNDISTINGKIPAQASTSNQLADKAFVTDAVQTNSAHFRGNWATWNDVPTDPTEYPVDDDGNTTPTSNDYMVVQDASGFPTSPDPALEGTWRFKYSGVWGTNGKNGWHPEYQVNETPLTSDQLAALNSGITAEAVTKLSGIEAGAEVNTIDSISVNGTAVTPDANKNVDLTIGDGIKTLSSADYDYPNTGTKTSVALWRLPRGIYEIPAGIAARTSTTGSVETDRVGSIIAVINRANQTNITLFGSSYYGMWSEVYVTSPSSGNATPFDNSHISSNAIMTAQQVVNNLTSTYSNLPLSAAQGKYLNDNKADKTAFTGTDGTSAGTMGLVPAPATTDAGKVLGADGSWTGLPEGIKTLTTADYNYPTNNPTSVAPWLLASGVYVVPVGLQFTPYYNASASQTYRPVVLSVASEPNQYGVTATWIGPSGTDDSMAYGWGRFSNASESAVYNSFIKIPGLTNSLTSTSTASALTANQGRILNNNIGTLSSLTTTAKTSTVAAINELDSDLAKTQALSGSGAPTTSTAGTVGQFYVDTATGDIYYLSAIVEESGQPDSYTWNKVATGSGGPTVVQTTGTSTTDVMSQNAVTSMVFADPATQNKIRIGNTATTGNAAMALGLGTCSASGTQSTALGAGATAAGNQSVSIGINSGKLNGSPLDTASITGGICIGQFSGSSTASALSGSIALGAYSLVSRSGEMNIGSTNTSYGYNSSNYRLLTGLYDPQSAHDAATKGYVDSHSASAFTTNEWNALWS